MPMGEIRTIEALEALYGTPPKAAVMKVQDHVTPKYAAWIKKSRFCILSSVGPGGTDGSPRGDDGAVALCPDPGHLLIPDWRGNNRLDTLRNIVEDGRVSVLFLVAGATVAVRVNGMAELRDDAPLRAQFERDGKQPATVIIVKVREVYSQCARALIRSGIWTRDDSDGLPTVGDFLREVDSGFDGAAYDAEWPARAAKSMW